jgi:hypothetical protein
LRPVAPSSHESQMCDAEAASFDEAPAYGFLVAA